MSEDFIRWIIGGLAIAIITMWQLQTRIYAKKDIERRKEKQEDRKELNDMYAKLELKNTQMYKEEKKRHSEEENFLKSEIRSMQEERKEERKEWLFALTENTAQLKNVASKLEVIPLLQREVSTVKQDIEDIKVRIN